MSKPETTPPCEWAEDSDGVWQTACGHAFVLNAATPAENGMRFCCYCGCGLRQKRYERGEAE